VRRSSTLLAAILAVFVLVPASPAAAVAVRVPRRIASDCSTDVTRALNRFFRSVPDGTGERPTVIRFPARACYRVNGTLRVQGRNWLRFAGSADAPATFRATKRGRLDFQGLSQRRHWLIVNSNHIEIRNIGVRSTNTRRDPEIRDGRFARYDARYEFEHGFDISGGSDVRIEDVTVRGVWGDCVALNPAVGRRFGGASTTGDRIVRLRCSWNGRQGISIVDATDILIDDIRIVNGRRAGIDLEPNSLHNVVRGVEIRNSYTNTHLLAFAASGRSEVSDVWIHHNVIARSGVPILYMSAADDTRRYDWTFSDNVLRSPAGSPAPALLFRFVTNASVERNMVPVVTTQSRIAVAFEQGLGTLRVVDNDFLDGGCYIEAIDSVAVESSGNLLGCP
jgi:Right handed beta helix region